MGYSAVRSGVDGRTLHEDACKRQKLQNGHLAAAEPEKETTLLQRDVAGPIAERKQSGGATRWLSGWGRVKNGCC
jgi:hypothetical protein